MLKICLKYFRNNVPDVFVNIRLCVYVRRKKKEKEILYILKIGRKFDICFLLTLNIGLKILFFFKNLFLRIITIGTIDYKMETESNQTDNRYNHLIHSTFI